LLLQSTKSLSETSRKLVPAQKLFLTKFGHGVCWRRTSGHATRLIREVDWMIERHVLERERAKRGKFELRKHADR
jgi:hypothetical protein